MTIREHHTIAPYTTFKVGGSARYFAIAESVQDLIDGFLFAKEKSLPVVVMGGGSNVLLDDGEAEALFIIPKLMGVVCDGVTLTAAAGESWDETVRVAVEAGLYGLENLSGIPGTVGGAVVQNIGAYGAALSETCVWVEVLDTKTWHVVQLDAPACVFGYRDSLFKQQPGRYVVLRAMFSLSSSGKLNIGYQDITEYFADREPTLPLMRAAVLTIRAHKFPDLTAEGTAGSFFKNPIVPIEEGERLHAKYPTLPLFPLPETEGYKVPLAWILDKVLSMRGFSTGHVRCFERQPLVLVADRNATAREVRACAREVSTRVFVETGIVIEPEVCIMHGAQSTHAVHL